MAGLVRQGFIVVKNNGKCNFIRNVLKANVKFCDKRHLSVVPLEYTKEKDPAPVFFNSEVQALLTALTRADPNKVFRKKRLETDRVEDPIYKFMTDEELKEEIEKANQKMKKLLQMPPVVKIREPIDHVFSRDPALQGFDTAKYVFTDITYGIKDNERFILIRDTDGTLKKADWETRFRMNQLYFPKPMRELRVPRMFREEGYLADLLEKGEYEFILDRACVQFEPDDPQYQRITSITYQHVNENNGFEKLRSTRHFGPMAFFLTWFKNIDNLLLDVISTGHIEEAESLIKLYNKMHRNDLLEEENVIECYIKEDSAKKGQLELAIRAYRELEKQRKEFDSEIRQAHGLV